MNLPDYTPVENDYPPGNPNMPFGYLGGLIGWVGTQSEWRVITYADLRLRPEHSREDYLEEFRTWHRKHQGDSKKTILFQYDVDARPDVTEALVRVHMEAGVPATVMVFRERIWDRIFKQEKRIEVDDSYRLDFGLLREFVAAGGKVGYHCNAWERAEFDLERARELFVRDLDYLRHELAIDCFSMHGGPLDESGRSNAQLDFEDLAKEQQVVWVHNGKSPSFHGTWDDGGAGHPNFKYRIGDVCEALGITNPGERLRCLFHPQYYRCLDAEHVNNQNQQEFDWFEEMLALYRARKGRVREAPAEGLLKWFRPRPRPEAVFSDSDWFAQHYWPKKLKGYEHPLEVIGRALANGSQPGQPIFVNGMSRSGTTLLTGLFDVHPDIAMSYELYPNYLIGKGDVMERYVDYKDLAYLLRNADEKTAYRLVTEKGEQDFVRFMACAGHSDLSTRDVGDLLFWYIKKYVRIYSYSDALQFIAASANLKRLRLAKANWGMKIQGRFEDYYTLWPKARFLYIMRDGRDILASQLKNGSFNPDPEALGKGWSYRIRRFRQFLTDNGAIGSVVKYEELVQRPRETLEKLCADLDIEFSDEMLRHHKHDISLLHNPRGQLSAARVAKPIDGSSVGRWRTELSPEQIAGFEGAAGELFFSFGY